MSSQSFQLFDMSFHASDIILHQLTSTTTCKINHCIDLTCVSHVSHFILHQLTGTHTWQISNFVHLTCAPMYLIFVFASIDMAYCLTTSYLDVSDMENYVKEKSKQDMIDRFYVLHGNVMSMIPKKQKI